MSNIAEKEQKEKTSLVETFIGPAIGELGKQLMKHRTKPELVNTDAIELALRQALTIGMLNGSDGAIDELEEQGEKLPPPEPEEEKEPYGVLGDIRRGVGITKEKKRTPFQRAISAFTDKRPILSKSLKRTKDAVDQRAFFVTGIFKMKMVKRAKKLLKKSLKEGLGLKEFQEKMQEFTDLSKSRLETVFRTNVASANEAGKFEMLNDPDLKGFVVGYEYRAITRDNRARETHEAFNGFIASTDHKVWLKVWPPNGYNCRCSVRPITRIKAKKNKWLNKRGELDGRKFPSYLKGGSRVKGVPKVFPKEFPDEGFKTRPGATLPKSVVPTKERKKIVAQRTARRRKFKRRA